MCFMPGVTPSVPELTHLVPEITHSLPEITPNRLSMADNVIFLVTGKDKKNALDKFKNSENIPATRITAQKNFKVLISGVN